MIGRVPKLTDEHHFALAMIATRSAQLEIQIEMEIAALMAQQPSVAKFVLKQFSGDRLVDFLAALLKDQFKEKEEEIKIVINKIKSLKSARNDLLHQIWGKTEEGLVFHTSLRPFRESKKLFKTAEEIEEIALEMLECTVAICKFRLDFYVKEELLYKRNTEFAKGLLDIITFEDASR